MKPNKPANNANTGPVRNKKKRSRKTRRNPIKNGGIFGNPHNCNVPKGK